jgi:uncharacterized protein
MILRQLRSRVANKYHLSRYSRMRKARLLSAIKPLIQEQTVQKPKIKETTISPTLVQEEHEMEASIFEIG